MLHVLVLDLAALVEVLIPTLYIRLEVEFQVVQHISRHIDMLQLVTVFHEINTR